jgi:hypothetical protein
MVLIVTVGQAHQFLTNLNSIEWMLAAPAWADGSLDECVQQFTKVPLMSFWRSVP